MTEADRVLIGAPYLGYASRLLHMPLLVAGLGGAVLLLVGTSWPRAGGPRTTAPAGAPVRARRSAHRAR